MSTKRKHPWRRPPLTPEQIIQAKPRTSRKWLIKAFGIDLLVHLLVGLVWKYAPTDSYLPLISFALPTPLRVRLVSSALWKMSPTEGFKEWTDKYLSAMIIFGISTYLLFNLRMPIFVISTLVPVIWIVAKSFRTTPEDIDLLDSVGEKIHPTNRILRMAKPFVFLRKINRVVSVSNFYAAVGTGYVAGLSIFPIVVERGSTIPFYVASSIYTVFAWIVTFGISWLTMRFGSHRKAAKVLIKTPVTV
jgi:hypothetical protein